MKLKKEIEEYLLFLYDILLVTTLRLVFPSAANPLHHTII